MTSIRLLTTPADLKKQINDALKKRLGRNLKSSEDLFSGILRTFVKKTIENTEVWASLKGNSDRGLDAHFGIWAGQIDSRLQALMEIWLNQIQVRVFPSTGKELVRVSLRAVRSDWAEISESAAGKTYSAPSGETLAWMDWLLNGNVSLSSKIDEYNISFDLKPGDRSRSGKAVMRISPNNPYKFPLDLVGGEPSANNNFVTRAFDVAVSDNNKEIKAEFMRIIQSAL